MAATSASHRKSPGAQEPLARRRGLGHRAKVQADEVPDIDKGEPNPADGRHGAVEHTFDGLQRERVVAAEQRADDRPGG
jgi:hypothetical protein